ncbi:thioesterase II family protein [Paenibacillus sp. 1P07SE]|uniref:thioesterase II family protein n=1 Tax=Paenibacillus sp. 1P07SE TaxID=3132209 RepID=UPI0039A70C17
MDTLLFCLPYAGASASIYQKWKAPLAERATVMPVEPAGRGSRMGEPFYAGMVEAAEDLAEIIAAALPASRRARYAIFGHSMGAKMAYETARLLRTQDVPEPVQLFLSGALPPHIPVTREKQAAEMSDEEWQQELERQGGTPPGLFADPELRRLFLPILRADYTLLENYRHEPEAASLTAPVAVLTGSREERSELSAEWQRYTSGPCRVHVCEGGHFFLHEDTGTVLDIISATLAGKAPALAQKGGGR